MTRHSKKKKKNIRTELKIYCTDPTRNPNQKKLFLSFLPLDNLLEVLAVVALSGIPEKTSEKQGPLSSLPPSILPSKPEEPSEKKRVVLPEPD